MNHASLFTGIGGFDLAAQWMGWENLFHCEWNQFCQTVLKHHFPKSISYGDITTTDFTIWRGRVDVLTGGFPCQPYSTAGKRLGKEDERHLWPEMLRAIREIAPRFVVGENVRGLLSWNGGMVFDEVQTELEASGYEVLPFLLPACGVNAPHRRDRIWFVAYRDGNDARRSGYGETRSEEGTSQSEEEKRERVWPKLERVGNQESFANSRSQQFQERSQVGNTENKKEDSTRMDHRAERPGNFGDVTDTEYEGLEGHDRERKRCSVNRCDKGLFARAEDKLFDSNTGSIRQQGSGRAQEQSGSGQLEKWKASWSHDDGRWPTQSPVCTRDDGFSSQLDGLTFSRWRQESIKAAGNAIVPQVALQIFKAIQQIHIT